MSLKASLPVSLFWASVFSACSGADASALLRHGGVPLNIDEMSFAADRNRNRLILYGGVSSEGEHRGTWRYEDQRYQLVSLDDVPSRRAALAYDEQRGLTYRYGGVIDFERFAEDQVFFFGLLTRRDGASTWVEVEDELRPPDNLQPEARYGAAMAYDHGADRLLLWGGFLASGGIDPVVWSYTSTSGWQELSTL